MRGMMTVRGHYCGGRGAWGSSSGKGRCLSTWLAVERLSTLQLQATTMSTLQLQGTPLCRAPRTMRPRFSSRRTC